MGGKTLDGGRNPPSFATWYDTSPERRRRTLGSFVYGAPSLIVTASGPTDSPLAALSDGTSNSDEKLRPPVAASMAKTPNRPAPSRGAAADTYRKRSSGDRATATGLAIPSPSSAS